MALFKIELDEGDNKETWQNIKPSINKKSTKTEMMTIREGEKVISNPSAIHD